MSDGHRYGRIACAVGLFLVTSLVADSPASARAPAIISSPPRDVQTEELLDFLEQEHFEALHPKRKALPKNRFTDRMEFRAYYRPLIEAYARHGKTYGVRWDYAVFQMMHETDSLRYTGQAHPAKNNFAGLGVTGDPKRWRIDGDRFATIDQGVLAHVQHLAAYAGAFDKYRSEVAQRIQELQRRPTDSAALEKSLRDAGVPAGVLTALSKKLKPADYESFLVKRSAAVEIGIKHGLVAPRTRFTWYHDIRQAKTFADLAGRWAADKQYGEKLQEYADNFASLVRRQRNAARTAGSNLRPWVGNWQITSQHKYGAYRNIRANSAVRISRDRDGRLRIHHGSSARLLAATPNRLQYQVNGSVNAVTVELVRKGNTVRGNFSGIRRQDNRPVGGVITSR